jgi:hypothetical protein
MLKMKLPVDYRTLDWKKGDNARVREEYVLLQEGKCYWCGCSLDEEPPERISNLEINWDLFPKGFLNAPVHLQHCHKTHMTEGAVHALCNAVMWQYYGR